MRVKKRFSARSIFAAKFKKFANGKETISRKAIQDAFGELFQELSQETLINLRKRDLNPPRLSKTVSLRLFPFPKISALELFLNLF